jgi:hypothetical protein
VSLQVILLIVGAASEGTGIVLIGFPDLLPHAQRLSAWLTHRSLLVVNRIRRLVGLRPLQKIVSISAAEESSSTSRVAITKTLKADATTDETIAFLLSRDQEAQADINALTRRLYDLEADTPRRLDQLRESMEAHVAQELTTALETYRPLRVLGTIALAIGLICVSVANFV